MIIISKVDMGEIHEQKPKITFNCKRSRVPKGSLKGHFKYESKRFTKIDNIRSCLITVFKNSFSKQVFFKLFSNIL